MSNSDNTLEVNDDNGLASFATNQIGEFLADFQANTDITKLISFSQDTGTGGGLGTGGEYTALLPGGGPLTEATNLRSGFKALCGSLLTDVNQLQSEMREMAADLVNATYLLDNAADETLTDAQMLEVLTDVFAGLGAPGGPGNPNQGG